MSIYRDGVRDGAYVIDIVLTETGFDGVEDTDWENLQSYAVDHGPVQLTIDYTDTQFTFKWKAPATSTLVFHWGDGTTSEVSGNDAALVTTTSSYSGAGTYDFWLSGDDAALTYIDISSQAFVSGDVSGWSALTDLTTLYAFSTGVSGDISSFVALTSLTKLYCNSTSVSGDVSGFSALTSLTELLVSSSNVTGDVSAWSTLASLTLAYFQSTSVTFDGTDSWTNASCIIRADDITATATMVDNMIAAFSTCTDCTINIAGTNAHRTAASNDDLNTLLANGNTITLNDVLGDELHTSLNAANDSATEAITAFADYVSTIDGATKVTTGADMLDMIPQGAEEVTNGDFETGDTTGWSFIDCNGDVDTYQGRTNVLRCVLTNSSTIYAYQAHITTTGKYYLYSCDIYIPSGQTLDAVSIRSDSGAAYNLAETSTKDEWVTLTVVHRVGLTDDNCDIYTYSGDVDDVFYVDNVSVKELQVLGSDLVTNGSFTLGADLNVSNCENGSTTFAYGTFANATPSGFDAISDGSSVHIAGTADEIEFVSGQKYVVTFDCILNGGLTAPYFNFTKDLGVTTSRTVEGQQLAVNGSNVFEFTSTYTGTYVVMAFYNYSTTANYQITNLSVKNSDTDWIASDGCIVYGGKAQIDGSQGGYSSLVQTSILTDGMNLIKFTISNYSAGEIRVHTGLAGEWLTADGTYNILMESTSANLTFAFNSAFIGSIDNVSVHKLTVQKEIAASTNYTGDHYILPVDENSIAIPVDYSAEAIVAQKITGETNATTDWVVGNNALITSVNTPVNDGSFALQIESDTTPTSGAYGAIALEGSVGTVDDTLYRISFYVRHIGSGTEWNCYISGASGGTNYRIGDTLENTDTTYVEYVYYWVQVADSDWLTFREVGNDNDGGVYVDSLSIKEVTFT